MSDVSPHDQVEIWSYTPDVAGERRRRQVVRSAALLVSLAAIVVGWTVFGPLGGFAGVAILLVVAVLGIWWVRDVVDAGVQRVAVRGDIPAVRELVVEGATGWVRAVDEPGFEIADGDVVVLPVGNAARVSVYPSVTEGDRDIGGGMQFHLVIDVRDADGTCRVAAFDRRIPFRIPVERALAEEIATLAGPEWDDEPDDPFGEVDRRRRADWYA